MGSEPLKFTGHYKRIFCNRNIVRGGARDRSIRIVFVALLALAGGLRLRLRCVVTGNVLPGKPRQQLISALASVARAAGLVGA
jgi:hypothetical protein